MSDAAPPPDARPFGAVLRDLRVAARLTQERLAELAGVSDRTVRNLERGVWRSPRPDTAELLADALGLAGPARDAFFGVVLRERPSRSADLSGSPGSPDDHPLLGRAAVLAALLDRLADPGVRVVTLLGPGGVGKTRLAREAARRMADAGRQVAWVPLEALVAPDEVLPAVARVLGASGQSGADPVARAAAAVAGRPLLLVLDNLEHLLDAAPAVSALVAAAPSVQVLATSREALRVGGEIRVRVEPLPLPGPDGGPDADAANPAVALFLDRAGVDEPSPELLRDAVRVVTALDGLPLAIELAAAQADSISVAGIARLLGLSGLEVLDSGRRDVHARLRSMDAAVRWSYDMLDDRARRLLRTVSVFRGGADLALLEEAADRLGDPELLRSLPALLRASLVTERDDADGGSRVAVLSPIRLFADAELEAAGERAAAERAHRETMRDFAREGHVRLMGPDVLAALAAMDRERDNLAVALDRAVRAGDAADAIALAGNMSVWQEARGEYAEGLRGLERALALDLSAADPEDVSLAGRMAALFAYFVGRTDRCVQFVELIAREAESAGHRAGLGVAETWRGDIAWNLRGDPDAAEAHFRRAVELLEPGGDTAELAQACTRLGDFLVEHGDPEGALPWLRRSVAIRRALGNEIYLATPLHHEAAALAELGRTAEARAGFLETARAAGDLAPLPAAYALYRLAEIDAASGTDAGPERRRRAALVLGAADAVLARHRVVIDPVMVPRRDGALADLAAALGAPERDRLLAEGRALTEAGALAIAADDG